MKKESLIILMSVFDIIIVLLNSVHEIAIE